MSLNINCSTACADPSITVLFTSAALLLPFWRRATSNNNNGRRVTCISFDFADIVTGRTWARPIRYGQYERSVRVQERERKAFEIFLRHVYIFIPFVNTAEGGKKLTRLTRLFVSSTADDAQWSCGGGTWTRDFTKRDGEKWPLAKPRLFHCWTASQNDADRC